MQFDITATSPNTIEIDFTNALEYKAEYTLTLTDSFELLSGEGFAFEGVTFNTIPPAFNMASFEADESNVSAKLENLRVEEPVSCIATVVIYNENNKMLNIQGGKYTIAKGESVTIATPKVEGATKAKCFVWDSLLNMETVFDVALDLE